jgi:cobalamin synthase
MTSEELNAKRSKGKSLQLVLLLIVLVALIAYKIFLPWTPFWVDLIVIATAAVFFLFTKAYSSKHFEGSNEK